MTFPRGAACRSSRPAHRTANAAPTSAWVATARRVPWSEHVNPHRETMNDTRTAVRRGAGLLLLLAIAAGCRRDVPAPTMPPSTKASAAAALPENCAIAARVDL